MTCLADRSLRARLGVALALALALAQAQGAVWAGASAAEWPGFLGPSGNLRLETRDAPSAGDAFGMRTRWKKPLGPGYSGIAVAGGRLYTMFSDGTDDLVVCLDATTGDERWRRAITPTWRGLQGSEDGPMSTPAVAGGRVVGLSPRGHLIALDWLTGEPRWRVDLVKTHGAVAPVYGFATSPLIDFDGKGAGRVVVQVGGRPDAGIVAFDLASGAPLWSVGTEPVEYQSAARMTLAGRRQLLGITDTRLYGIDPEGGQVLWAENYLERPQDAGAYAIQTEPDRFLVNTRTGASLFELTVSPSTDAAFAVRRLWTSTELKQSYAIPIYHDGQIYGYSSEFLTAIDARTGKRVWKSRPPGKGALLLLNDVLIAWSIDGALVAIQTSPDGYRERARLKVMERGSITNPGFADGRIYVRGHEEIAAVEFTRARRSDGGAADVQPQAESSPFTDFVGRLDGADDKQALIDAFLKQHASYPIVEGDDVVHFVYRGRARDLGLFLGSVSRRGADVMRRVRGTDFWFRSYRLEPGGRYDYQFQVDYDRLIPDPLNPKRAPGPGEFSELVLPGWVENPALREPAPGAPRGSLEAVSFAGNRKVQVYLPHGYAESQERYPLLIVNGGDEALKFGAMDRVLDNVIGHGVEPLVVAFVGYAGGRTWRETGGPRGNHYASMVAHELSDFLQRRYRLRPGRENRAVMGTGLSGYVGMLAALRFPDALGKVATQSLYTHNQPMADGLARLIEPPGDAPLGIYMDWTTYDLADPGEGLDLRRDNARLAARLREAGHGVAAHEVASGPGWGTWRARTAEILETLFPAPDRR